MPIEIPKDKWPGTVRQVTIGATSAEGGTRLGKVVVGGETTPPAMMSAKRQQTPSAPQDQAFVDLRSTTPRPHPGT